MRVLLVEPLSRGGIAQYAYELACALSRAGHEVTLLAPPDFELAARLPGVSPPVRFTPALYPLTARARHVRSPALRRLMIALASISDGMQLIRTAAALPVDVIHLQGGHPMDMLYLLAARRTGRPVVYTAHNVLPHRLAPYHRLAYRITYSLPDFTIIHTEDGQAQLLSRFRLKPERMRVIPHPPLDGLFDPKQYPTPAEARARLGLNSDDKMVLFFGQIRPNKDLPSLVRAIAQVRRSHPNVRLLVAGQPLGSMKDVMLLVSQLDLASAITLHLRYLPLDEVPNYFQAADVIALPYVTVTQSGVLALALAFDKPVVASQVGGLPELARSAGIGALVPPRDSAALAESISAELRSPSKAREESSVVRWPEAARLTALLYVEAASARRRN